MKKILSILSIAALFAVSCDKATVGTPSDVVTPGLVKYSLTVNKPADTKVTVADNGTLTWDCNGKEVLTVSCEAWEGPVTVTVPTGDAGQKSVDISFNAPDHEGSDVFVSYGSVAASCEGSAQPVLAGAVSFESNGNQTGAVTLVPVAAYLKFNNIPEGVQSIKIAAINGEIVADKEAKLITVTGLEGTVCGVNVLPGTYEKGLVLALEGSNGSIIKSISSKGLTLGADSFKVLSLEGASPVQLTGTVSAKTTYSQALDGEKGTDENGANNTENTNRVWDIKHELTSVDKLSESLKSFVSFASYECDDQVLTSGTEFSSISLGEKDLKANHKFECGALCIPVGSLSTKVQITGLPYKVDNFANDASNWTPNNNYISFKTDGAYLYTGTVGVSQNPEIQLKNSFYFPESTGVLINGVLSKQSSLASNYETYVTLGSIKATTGSNKSGINKQLYSKSGSLEGDITLVAGCNYRMANRTYNYAINAIEVLYN